MKGWAWASLCANISIVITGGLVRLTDSGLGCPTWPKCTSATWTAHRALGIHGAIEFGNRLLTYVLVAIAVATLVAVWRSQASTPLARTLAIALAIGIPLQGVVGGITVLTHLNPWAVSLHLVLSMALISGCVLLIGCFRAEPHPPVRSAARRVVTLLALDAVVVVYLGTVVTGSGPHAGDELARRNGLDPLLLSQLHAGAVVTLVALTIVALVLLRGTRIQRTAWTLMGVEIVQAGIGVAQYNLGLPILLVAAHLAGAGVFVAVTTALVANVGLIDERVGGGGDKKERQVSVREMEQPHRLDH